MHKNQIHRKIELDFGTIHFRSDDILAFYPNEDILTINMEQLKIMLETLIKITDGKPKPFFSNNRTLKHLGYKERQYIGENIHLFASASAVISTPIVKFIGHTITHLFKPKIPMAFFTTEEEAIKWLKTFL